MRLSSEISLKMTRCSQRISRRHEPQNVQREGQIRLGTSLHRVSPCPPCVPRYQDETVVFFSVSASPTMTTMTPTRASLGRVMKVGLFSLLNDFEFHFPLIVASQVEKLTKTQLLAFLDSCKAKYMKARVEPGERVSECRLSVQ